ncbi:hypothetical protein HRbin19_01140 [bacterium HR19]|nr:hypothetical protein HRbin19_01140 [bacterium HR19]
MSEIEKKREMSGLQERLRMFEEFRIAKNKILSQDDFMEVTIKDKKTGEIKKKKMLLKSGWRKIKLFFGISSEILEIKREKDGDKIIYMCKARVSAPSGMSAEAVGICSSDEPGKSNMPEYILSSIAQTRAINKAIADLVGADFDEEIDIEKLSEEDLDISHIEPHSKSEKALPSDKTKLVSLIFGMIHEIEGKISRTEIFSKIKDSLGIPKDQNIKITQLDIDQLKKVESILRSEIQNLKAKETENFF